MIPGRPSRSGEHDLDVGTDELAQPLGQELALLGSVRAQVHVDQQALDGDELDYLKGAFRLMTELLLRQQVADFQAGEPVNNYVPPDAMSTRERDMLIDAFKAIATLRDRVRTEFTGDVF